MHVPGLSTQPTDGIGCRDNALSGDVEVVHAQLAQHPCGSARLTCGERVTCGSVCMVGQSEVLHRST
jgi:hypothetical protein